MARRLLVIWLTRLSSDLWLRRHPVAGPFAVIARQGNSDRIFCLNAEAAGLGLARGMALADARAIWPDLITIPADSSRDAAGLEALRRLTMRYAPQVGLDGTDGLVADITGVSHLFGGESELRTDFHANFTRVGFALESAIAPTKGAAWALSRHGGGIIPEGAMTAALSPLPVSALRLDSETTDALARLGLLRIADLIALPRAPLAKRFGPDLLRRLDQALGQLPEAVAAPVEAPTFSARLSLPEPIGLVSDVMAGLDRLLLVVCNKLAQAQMGARRMRFELNRVDRRVIRLEIGLARPMRDALRISALFARQVEGVDSGFGIDRLRLEAYVAEPLAPEQIGNREAQARDALADLISRLGNRLGFEHILRAHPQDSPLPENSFRLIPAVRQGASHWPAQSHLRRPVTIFPPEPLQQVSGHPPARFFWRGVHLTTLRAHGPERITPDWWNTPPSWSTGLRDYWRIETSEGPRLWVFHTPQAPAWAVQGEFL